MSALSHIPIFVINLKRSVERRKRMAYQLDRLNLQYSFFDAVDGKALSSKEKAAIEKNRNPCVYNKKFSDGEIGCALTQLQVYQHIVNHNIQHALILEDDVYLESSLPDLLQTTIVQRFPKNLELLLCAYVQKSNIYAKPYKRAHMQFFNRTKIKTKQNTFVIGKSIYFSFHAAGYIVSLEGARKLLLAGTPISMPADMLTGNAHAYGIHNYILQTPCIRQHSIWALDSTIKDNIQQKGIMARCSASPKIYMKTLTFVLQICLLWFNFISYTARGYGLGVRLLQKLGIIPIQKL